MMNTDEPADLPTTASANSQSEGDLAALFQRTLPRAPGLDMDALLAASAAHASRRWRISMVAPIAASILFLAGGTMLLLAWIWSSGTNLAFAEVQEKVAGTRTVTFTQIIKAEGNPFRKTRIFIQAPGLMRGEQEDGTYTIMDSEKRQSLTLDPKEKKAVLFLGLSEMIAVPNVYELVRDAAQDVLENLPEQAIGGKKAVGYRVRFGVGANKKEARVWVDPKTKLPVRIEQSEKDQAGREIAQLACTDFVFDAPLDAALFRMTPPEGYKVVTMGTATALPPAPNEADKAAPLVTPGVGIGPARFGMSKEEVIKVLGPPDSIPPEGKGIMLLYFSRGFQVDVTPKRGLVGIHCVTQKTFLTKVNDFRGKTKEGIAMGASEKMIEQAYGKPDSRTTNGPATTYLRYNNPDLQLTLFDDKLVGIFLQPAPPPKP
jgi:outer membrane lipoprotein-sorting protein